MKVKNFSSAVVATKQTVVAFIFLLVLTGFLYGESRSDSIPKSFQLDNAGTAADSILESLTESGYPFGSLESIVDSADSVGNVRFDIDSGPKIDSVRLLFIPTDSVPRRLLARPVGGTILPYEPELSSRIPSLLELNRYVSFASCRNPLVENRGKTCMMVLPVDVTIRRNLFVDGALSWSSTDDRGVMGNLDLDLLNLFRIGESVSFIVYGDREIQKASLGISVPWFLNTPFSLKSSGAVEVRKDQYGRIEGALGAGYRIGGVWEAGMAGRYYELSDSSNAKRTFTGINLSLDRFHAPFKSGVRDWGTKLSAGSGILRDRKNRMPRSDVSVGGDIQIPLGRIVALGAELFGSAIATAQPEKLHSTEKVQIGGIRSVRGYSESSYSFIGAGYLRSECRFYFSKTGSFLIFGDPAAGVPVHFSFAETEYLFGYGGGVRIPAGKVNFSLVWARHYREGSGPGRIHVGIRN